MKYFVFRIASIFTLILLLGITIQAQQVDVQQKPMVIEAFAHGITPPLRDLKNLPPKAGQPLEIPMLRRNLQAIQVDSTDGVVQDFLGSEPMPAPIENFEGLSNADNEAVHGFRLVPPDTNGDVGPNHYVQYLNLIFAIYDKSGNMLVGPLGNYVLWQDLNLPPDIIPWGDPIVLYDHLADRWMMSEFAFPDDFSGPFYQLIAVSQTPDPTGSWYTYAYIISNTKLNDYPKFGVWPDGYYMSVNLFSDVAYEGVGVAVFERDKMLNGNPNARMVYFELPYPELNYGSMLPADLDGPPPPPGTPNYFAEIEFDEWGWPQDQLGIFEFHVDWNNIINSTFTRIGALPTEPFDPELCGYSRSCIPQRGTSDGLDAISDRLMYRLQYRNFGTHQSMVTNHTVNAGRFRERTGIRWYELRDGGGGWDIYQQGTYAPGLLLHRWMGSIAMDGDGNMALGYSASSQYHYPSIRYTGRLASDPPGTMPWRERILFRGKGSQLESYNRWGDYSMMAVDPTDDRTFWYTNEYYAETSEFNWQTRIGSFAFPTKQVVADTKVLSNANPNATPVRFTLNQNYPNPFNPETWIPYNLAADANVTITIYNIQGNQVRTISLGARPAGSYITKDKSAYWDGRSDTGELVSSGIYFYHLKAGDFQATKRMLILK